MIAVKFSKDKAARFVSHIDLLRHITRTIRRMGIEISYSEGFNPHMKINLSAPLPLGIRSRAEYFSAECKGVSAEEFKELYNRFCIKGLEVYEAWEVEKKPNFQGVLAAADFSIPIDISVKNVQEILSAEEFVIQYTVKGKEKSAEVRPLIYGLSKDGDCVKARLAQGNQNLRADRLLNQLNVNLSKDGSTSDIIRLAQYTEIDGQMVDFDAMLETMKI